ncbi:MAG: DNA-protecting protein DprA [Dehalococcoidia bacterium]|nr:DNA-protecting protein DprA [Dehalococcoidia bacterium]
MSHPPAPDDEQRYWLALHRLPGVGPKRFRQLLDHFGSIRAAWNATPTQLGQAGIDRRTAAAIVEGRGQIDPDRETERLAAANMTVLTWLDEDRYPPLLRTIAAPPPVLYIRGELATEDRSVAAELAGDLASAGLTVVSGLARGIDGQAHRVALAHGGRTLAVLGHGLDTVYPAEHRALAAEIVEHGALLSEYPPRVGPAPEHFPIRNRIISGLALATVVVEAGEASGALITARTAADEGRDVFAVPGPVISPLSRGCHQLIQEGAGLVNEAQDILAALNLHMAPPARQLAMALPANDEEERVLAALQITPCQPRHIDDVIRDARLPAKIVGSTLTVLTLKGLAQDIGSQHYASVS